VLNDNLRWRHGAHGYDARCTDVRGSVARVIDVSSVLGAKVFCETGPVADPMDRPLTVEVEFAPEAWSNKHVHPCGVQELRELRSLRNEQVQTETVVADLTLDRHILQEIVRKAVKPRARCTLAE
jgi:hypothetical protein